MSPVLASHTVTTVSTAATTERVDLLARERQRERERESSRPTMNDITSIYTFLYAYVLVFDEATSVSVNWLIKGFYEIEIWRHQWVFVKVYTLHITFIKSTQCNQTGSMEWFRKDC